jgi:hypothetical protein
MRAAINLLSGFLITVLAVSPQVLLADSQFTDKLPKECCPNSCSILEKGDRLLVDHGQKYFVSRRFGKVQLPDNMEVRLSPDGYYHICLGITDFSDPVVKCLFSPPIS